MGKLKRGEREFSKEQKLIQENQRLKKAIASLRKQLARVDLDRHGHIKEILEQHYQEDDAMEAEKVLEKLKEEWKCKICENGFLEIFIYNRIGGTYYYRICSNAPICKNRTKSQKYNPDEVKGIVKKSLL